TLLHSSAILSIALAPHYFPEIMGSNNAETVEVSIDSSQGPVESQNIASHQPEVAIPTRPEKVEEVVVAPKKIKTTKNVPAKAKTAEPVLAQPAVEVTND